MIKFYKVGGCVRDSLLGLTPSDIDWEVIGASVDDMLNMGFIQVGSEFPVFIHPVTKQEYSIGRIELVECDNQNVYKFVPNLNTTISDSVKRRDFTINAIAIDENNKVIDCVNGVDDLNHKIIRHINKDTFITDPIRVLRACRLSAQLNFSIAPETELLLKGMVKDGMLNNLTPERVWKETKRALNNGYDSKIYFELLNKIGALKILFPEIYQLTLASENPIYHPSKNTFKHTMIALSRVQFESDIVKFAVLCHDIGKGLTPKELLPKHHNHDINGVHLINTLCKRLKIPSKYRIFATTFCRFHMQLALFNKMNISTKYDLIKLLSYNFKDRQLLQNYILCFKADWMGENIVSDIELLEDILKNILIVFDIMKNITLKDLPEKYQNSLSNFTGEKFGILYREYMIKYLTDKLKNYNF